MKNFLGWKLLLLLILLLAVFLRFYQLGNIPYGSTGDETAYIYNAYSIWHTGKDVMGNFLPLSFNFHSSESPVPVYLTAPFVGILGLNLFNARLLSALLGVGSVFILFLLASYLFNNKWLGVISAFTLAISTWALQIDRELWDVDFAKFFYLLGIYIFIKNVKNNKYIYSFIPFALAFYSYHGTKVFFVLLIPVLILLFRKPLLERKKSLVMFCTLVIFLFVSFLLILKFQGVVRQNEVYLLNDPNATAIVNIERTKNKASDIIKKILSNKPLYFLRVIRENYLEAFSTNFLFLYGETGVNTQMEDIYFRGVFYIVELPLLLFGLYKLITAKNNLNRNLLLSLLLIAAFPSAITYDRNFVNRDVMMLPILIMIISLGTYSFLAYILKFKKKYKYISLTIFVAIYLFLFASYYYQYYYRWSVYGAEAWNASSRELANYLVQNRDKFKSVYVSSAPNDVLIQYATFAKVDPRLVQKVWNENPIKIYNITMVRGCLNNGMGDVKEFLPSHSLYLSYFNDCHYRSTPSAKLYDIGDPSHGIWNIYEN